MIDLLRDIEDDLNVNEFLKGYLSHFDDRKNKKGYFHKYADPSVLTIVEGNMIKYPDDLAEFVDFDDKKDTKEVLSDAIALGYLAQIYYVKYISEKLSIKRLPEPKALLLEVVNYRTSIGDFQPLNNFLDDMTNNVMHRIKTADDLRTSNKNKVLLAKYAQDYIYSGQVMAVLQGYQANLNNLNGWQGYTKHKHFK